MNQNKIKQSWKQRIASLMIIVLMAGSLLFDMPPAYAAESTQETEGQVCASDTEGQSGIPEDKSYTGEGYTVDATVTSFWEGGYNLCVTVRNTSEETIHNWGILFETQDSIKDLYNAEILSNEDGMYLLRNKVYNQDIPEAAAYYLVIRDVMRRRRTSRRHMRYLLLKKL